MNTCFFVSDLSGSKNKYNTLLKMISQHKPDFVFLSGNLFQCHDKSYIDSSLRIKYDSAEILQLFNSLKLDLECNYPDIFLLPGNIDQQQFSDTLTKGENDDLWRSINNSCIVIGKYRLYGLSFLLHDEGISKWQKSILTGIAQGINNLFNDDCLDFGIVLLNTDMEEISLSDKSGFERNSSVLKAIEDIILNKNPYILMDNGSKNSNPADQTWKKRSGRTLILDSFQDNAELTIISFELHQPEQVTRKVIKL